VGLRTRALRRLAGVDARLHDRLLAARLAARPPAPAAGPFPAPAGAADVDAWWEQALALTPRLVAAQAAPEPARLVFLVFGACPPERAGELETQVRTALGAPPSAAELEKVLPAGADRMDGTKEPLASWLRVWGQEGNCCKTSSSTSRACRTSSKEQPRHEHSASCGYRGRRPGGCRKARYRRSARSVAPG
jgi:hypothetical protein